MRTGIFAGAARAVFVVVLLLSDVSFANPLDGFWQGRRSAIWEQGVRPKDGISNWYSDEPRRRAVKVPRADAIFARGAVRSGIAITGRETFISRMLIDTGAPQYTFNIREGASLNITNVLLNRAAKTPRFTVRQNAALRLHNDARLRSSTTAKSARIFVDKGGSLVFSEESNGGNAVATNDGDIVFRGNSSAERMTIVNRFSGSFPYPHVTFLGRSNAGSASFLNQNNTYLDFSGTLGDGNRRVTTGRILNFGWVLLGRNTLAVKGNYIQELRGATGNLAIEIAGGRFGAVRVTGVARLGGRLRVQGDTPPGTYLVLRAEGGLRGRFELDTNVTVNARLDHFPNEVILRIFE